MTRWEVLDAERRALRARRLGVVLALALAVLVAGRGLWPAARSAPLAALAGVLALPFAIDVLLRSAVPPYRRWAARAAAVGREIAVARRGMAALAARFRARREGERFKTAYELAGRNTRELEQALSVGMHREGREVFVTAFMRGGTARRVTASIGSPFRCSAADDPARWKDHVERLGCDEVRQYHNHPVHHGHTRPSPTDLRSSGTLRRLLGPHGAKLRSFVICWNGLREWKVFEYEPGGRHWLEHEYDALEARAD